MEFLGKLLGQATLIEWAVSAILPFVMGAIWKYWNKTGIAISQEKIAQINGIAKARAGQFIAKLLSGELGWADLAKFAKDAAAVALEINPDIKAMKDMTGKVMADRIESQVGQMASADPTLALPTPPAGATVGNVAVAGVSSSSAIKEVADTPTAQPPSLTTSTPFPTGGANIRGEPYTGR